MTLTFDTVYLAHASYVRSVAVRAVGHTDAPDVAQEVWIRVARGLSDFRGEAAIRSWLHRITLNVAADAVRRRCRRPDGSEVSLAFASTAVAAGETPEHAMITADRDRRIRAAVRTLRHSHRSVLRRWLSGDSLRAIAQRTGLPLGTVKSQLYRGRALVRAPLWKAIQ